MGTDQLERWVKIVGIFAAAVSAVFAAVQFVASQRAKSMETAFALKRPFLDRQLKLYTEASRAAAIIASADDAQQVARARARFLELFWGELAMVEDEAVEAAMVDFKAAMDGNRGRGVLGQCSLVLAHAARASLARSWGTRAWESYYKAAPVCPVA